MYGITLFHVVISWFPCSLFLENLDKKSVLLRVACKLRVFSFSNKNWRFKIFAAAFKGITSYVRASNAVRTLKKAGLQAISCKQREDTSA